MLLRAILVGLGATAMMDLWNLFLKRAFGIPSLNYCLFGRWVRHMPATFVHQGIGAAAPRSFECQVGWIAHYSIGVSLAIGFLLLNGERWLSRPTLIPALLYGLGTVVFPFFVMQPSLGLGVASSRTPKPSQARLKSLMTHLVFGTGLFVSGVLVRRVS